MTPQVTQATMPLLIMIMGKMFENKTENPFSLKDDEREMTRQTKTKKLTKQHDNSGNIYPQFCQF